MQISFIRHGKTIGNLSKKYIGITDEPLCAEGISRINKKNYPDCDIVICSPMKRCIQTAEIIYPDKKIIVYDNLKECCFGDFEGKNYMELSGNPDYQKWIDSNGKLPFPNGENPENFKKRCIEAFEKAIAENNAYDMISFVVHGGTIMSIFEKYAVPHGDFYDFHVENASGFITEYNGYIKIKENI